MKRLILFALIGAVVCGCQPGQRKHWSKTNTTLEQAIKDCKECKETARGEAQVEHYYRYREGTEGFDTGSIANNDLNSELERSNRDFDEQRFFRSCMRSRGYDQIPEHRISSDMRKTNRFGGGEIQHLTGE